MNRGTNEDHDVGSLEGQHRHVDERHSGIREGRDGLEGGEPVEETNEKQLKIRWDIETQERDRKRKTEADHPRGTRRGWLSKTWAYRPLAPMYGQKMMKPQSWRPMKYCKIEDRARSATRSGSAEP
jgi:hypothetical protein